MLSETLHHPQQAAKSHPLGGAEVRLSAEIITLITNAGQHKKLKRFISEAYLKIEHIVYSTLNQQQGRTERMFQSSFHLNSAHYSCLKFAHL